jgi:hypothetical protein
MTYSKQDISHIANQHEIGLPPDWTGVDAVYPLIDLIVEQGGTVILKFDGERQPDQGDNGKITVIAQGGCLDGDLIRGDFVDLDSSLCHLLGCYFSRPSDEAGDR